MGVLMELLFSVLADLKTDRIPNALTAAGMAAAVIVGTARDGPSGLPHILMDVLLMFIITFLLFAFKALRGGDGKLMCVTAAFLGFKASLIILFTAMIIASAAGIIKKFFCGRVTGKYTYIHFSVPVAAAAALYAAYIFFAGGILL